MNRVRQWTVEVPATSANLGPGFDCLGLALSQQNTATLTYPDSFRITMEGEAAEQLPRDSTHAVAQALKALFAAKMLSPVDSFSLHTVNRIAVSSGLGSSAAAIVSGLLLGRELLLHLHPDARVSDNDLLKLATDLEGHPDNVTPAMFGGCTVTWRDAEDLRVLHLPVPDNLVFVAATPYFPLSTTASRQVVPNRIALHDVVFNLSQMARLTYALTSGSLDALRGGFGDLVHEPYRKELIPGSGEVCRAANRTGALTTTLSGAGPTLLAWCDDIKKTAAVADSMTLTWREHGVPCRTEVCRVSQAKPAVVSVN